MLLKLIYKLNNIFELIFLVITKYFIKVFVSNRNVCNYGTIVGDMPCKKANEID